MTKSRSYIKSHPWITFELDLNRASPRLWLLLGEAASKCDHIAGVPLSPPVAHDLHLVYLTKGVRGTTAIEGNTLSEEQVRQRIEGGSKLPPSQEYLGKEIDNIVEGCNKITGQFANRGDVSLTMESICEYNRLVLNGLPLAEGVIPGQIRAYSVGVFNYRGAPPEDCEFLLRRLCEWLNTGFQAPTFEKRKIYGILKAVLAHLYLAWIHPFGDGNGRTARLVEFQILLSVGVPTPAAHLLSNHYNTTRTEYYRHLDMSSKKENGVMLFVEYALQGFVDQLKAQLELIRSHQLDVHWINYIHECFRDNDTVTGRRQRHLVLDLTDKGEVVTLPQLLTISPRMAEHYRGKTLRTVKRDVNSLVDMGLVTMFSGRIFVEKGQMAAFLPFVVEQLRPPKFE